MGRTYGVMPLENLVDVEEIREAYLTYRPPMDDHHPPPNSQVPPFTATGGEVDLLPDIIMPELDDLFAKPVNELVEASEKEDDGFTWEHGGINIHGKHFDAEHIAFVMKTWMNTDD